MEYYIYKGEDELTHWGVRGMKWGVRRYQNKDGSLTPAGKKRYEAELNSLKAEERALKKKFATRAKLKKLEDKRKELDEKKKELDEDGKKDSSSTPRARRMSEISTDELRAMTDRMNAERNFYEAQKNLANAAPKQVSKGKKFISSMLDDVIMPAAKSAGKEWLEKTLKDAINSNSKTPDVKVPDLDYVLQNYKRMSPKQITEAAKSAKELSTIKKFVNGDDKGSGKKKKDKDEDDDD